MFSISVDDLQKRWKNLRDYYVKEKKKERSGRSGSPAKKRKRPPYFESLRFLDGTQEPIISDGNINEPIDQDLLTGTELFASSQQSQDPSANQPSTFQQLSTSQTPATSQQSSSSPMLLKGKKTKMTLFEQHLVKIMQADQERSQQQDDPNKNFLLSLLPDMNSMTPSQQFDFKFQVMNIIKSIKYSVSVQHENFQQPQLPLRYQPAPSQNVPIYQEGVRCHYTSSMRQSPASDNSTQVYSPGSSGEESVFTELS